MQSDDAVRCIVLDAMGVIFNAADDVAELLIPFVCASGGTVDAELINTTYVEASLGVISADEFWVAVGLEPAVEDEYLSKHTLVPGVMEFLRTAKEQGIPVWCLSNDIDRWSRKLRAALKVESFLSGAVISSEVRSRKPSSAIYQCLLDRSGYYASEMIFVDDREKNVEAALAMGIPSIKFTCGDAYSFLAKQIFAGAL